MEVPAIAIHIDIIQHLHKLQNKDRRVTLDDYERLGQDAADAMAKGIERESPRAAKALRRIADSNVALGRSERDLNEIRNKNEKQAARLLQINEELAAQEERAARDAAKRSRIEVRANRQRDRRARALKDITEQQFQLAGKQRDQARGVNEVRQSQLDLTEARKSGVFTAKELADEEQRIRNLQRENSTRGRDITLATKDLERTRREATRTTQLLGKHESTLNDINKDAAARTRERTKLTEEGTRVRDASNRSSEEAVRASENEVRAHRSARNALMDYNGALNDTHQARKRNGGQTNLVGRMLTDLPFVPGGKAGAVIGTGMVTVLASVAEAVVTASQALAVLPAVAAAGGAALGTLALGLTGFGNALSNMGPYGSDPKQFAQALAGLSPAAQQAALEIQHLVQGPLKGLKDATQESLFAGVPQMLQNATNTFLPSIQQLTTGLAGSMNNMFGDLLGQVTSPEGMQSLANIINNIVTAFQHLEPAVAPFVSALMKITETGSTFLPGFADAVTRAANSFNNFITKAQQDGSLQTFIQKGIDAAVELKNIIVEIVKRIYETFGNKSPEEFRNTLHSIVDAAFAVVQAIVGISHVVNDLMGPIQSVANAVGGWDSVIKTVFALWLGSKALGGVTMAINGISTLLGGLPAEAAVAGAGMGTGLTGGLTKAGFLLRGGVYILPAAIAYSIIWGNRDTNPQTQTSGGPGQPQLPGSPMQTPPGQQSVPMPPGTPVPPGFHLDPNGQIVRDGTPPPRPTPTGPQTGPLPQAAPGQNNTTFDRTHPGPIPMPNAGPPFNPFAIPGIPGNGPNAGDRRRELENQFANDPRFNVDPFAGMPGAPGVSPSTGPVSTPGAPGQPPISYRQTNPYEPATAGVYNVDPQQVQRETYDLKVAGRELGDAQRDLAITEQLRKENLASEMDVIDKKQKVDDKQQSLIEAQQNLTKAQSGTFDKINQGTKNLQGVQQEIGAKIDDDFGISKGLPGIFENLFKVIANMAMAPVIGALTGITNVAGTAGPGTGLLGMLSEGKSMFGPTPNIFGNFTDPDTIAKYGQGPGASTGGMPGMPGPASSASLGGPLTNLPDPDGAHPQVSYLAALAERFNLKLIAGKNHHVNDGLNHPKGLAGDFSNGTGNTPQQAQFAQFLHDNFGDLLNEEIYSDPNAPGVGISMGQNHQFDAGTLADHLNHIHASVSDANAATFEQRVTAMLGGQMPMSSPSSTYPGSTSFPGSSGAQPVFVTNWPGGGTGAPGGGGALPGSPASGGGLGPLPGPGQGGLSASQWEAIAGGPGLNESSGNWAINSGNGYSGGLQFTPGTWNDFGGQKYAPEAWQASKEEQMDIANKVFAKQGAGAWPAVSAAHPELFKPGVAAAPGGGVPPSGPGGGALPGLPGPGTGPVGAPPDFPFSSDNAPGGTSFVPGSQPFGPIENTGTSYTPAFGRSYGEGRKPSEGLSASGLAGMAGGAAGMMPGMGQLAQIGIGEINRAIQAGAQLAGNGVEGLMETFLPVESELADPARGWFGRVLGAVAGVKPVAQNIAGIMGGTPEPGKPGEPGQPPLTPEQVAAQKNQDHLGQGQGAPGPNPVNVNINNTQAPPDLQTTVAPHQEAAAAPPGRFGP